MSKIRSRVPVLCADSERIVFYAHREQAERLLAEGAARAEGACLRITGPLASDVRPGSFGIRREHVATNQQYGLSGGIVFSHRRTYERLAAA